MTDIDIPLINVRQILDQYCSEFRNLYKNKLILNNKKATGNLIQSIDTHIKIGGFVLTVVLNVADYYKYVEEGRKPGKFPPLAAIKQWIKDKPILPRENENGKLPTEDQLAFLIGRKIAQEGIQPGYQLKDTLEQLNSTYINKLQEALKRDFELYSLSVLVKINEMIKF